MPDSLIADLIAASPTLGAILVFIIVGSYVFTKLIQPAVIQMMEKQAEQVRLEDERLKAIFKAHSDGIAAYAESSKAALEKVSEMTGQFLAGMRRYEDLKGDYDSLKSDLSKMSEQVRSLEGQNRRMEKENAELRIEIVELRAQLNGKAVKPKTSAKTRRKKAA